MSTMLQQIDDAILGIRKPMLDRLVAEMPADPEPWWLQLWLDLELQCSQRNLQGARSAFATFTALPPSKRPYDLHYRMVTGWTQFLAESTEVDEALDLLQDLDVDTMTDVGYQARALRTLALCATQQGRYDDAQTHGEHAVALLGALPYPAAFGNALTELATIYSRKGLLADAVRMQFRAYETFTTLDNPIALAIAMLNLGVLYGETGNREKARTYFEQVRTIDTGADAERFATYAALNIGLLHLEDNDATQAIHELLVAERLSTDKSKWSMATGARRGLSAAHRVLGNIEQARLWLQRAEDALAMASNEPQRITHVIEEARLLMCEGDHQRAIDILEPIADAARQRADVSALLRSLAELHVAYAATQASSRAYQCLLERTQLETSVTNTTAQQRLALFTVEREREEERRTAQRERDLLHSVMPGTVAERILSGERRIADVHTDVAILFADLVGFTTISENMEPKEVLDFIERIFTQFDTIIEHHGLVRIKTIGDAYMAVANLPDMVSQPAHRAAHCAMDMMKAITDGTYGVRVRIGMHIGTVVAGVIGATRPMYDIWGDAVNIAARMEQHSEPGRIHISQAFAEELQGFGVTERGTIEVKGKGMMTTYWLERL
ncbi:MAG: tetratricopeptide repeat protein [Ignavibacteria bacterium]|nr:tetratricopeptide repeat protein [Ignavibacteria bacterium]